MTRIQYMTEAQVTIALDKARAEGGEPEVARVMELIKRMRWGKLEDHYPTMPVRKGAGK